MKNVTVVTPGHRYVLDGFENRENRQTIQFIEKTNQFDQLVTVNDGTTNEDLIEVLIDRMKFLQNLAPCKENACAITKMEEALMWLEKRTADRLKRGVEGTPNT